MNARGYLAIPGKNSVCDIKAQFERAGWLSSIRLKMDLDGLLAASQG